MLLPSIPCELGRGGRWVAGTIGGRDAVGRTVNTIAIVIALEACELPMKVERIPEEQVVEIFAPNGPDQSFNEGMRHRGVRHGFDFLDLEDPKVGEPAVESEQRIVIGADPRRWRIAGHGLIEHAARRYPSMYSPPMPNPMIRRVNTSITTRTQWLRSKIDSQRNRSTLQRLSLECAKKVSQEGPEESGYRQANFASARRTISLSILTPKACAIC